MPIMVYNAGNLDKYGENLSVIGFNYCCSRYCSRSVEQVLGFEPFAGRAGDDCICAVFNVVRAWNTGVSFSMFNNYGNLGAILLSVIAGVIVVFWYIGCIRKRTSWHRLLWE